MSGHRPLTVPIVALVLAGATPCRAEAPDEQTAETPKTASFLVVDLDGDGIDLIPLSESNVYFDVDGDELAERTAWIGPNDAFLGVLTRDENWSLGTVWERFAKGFVGGARKLEEADTNKDGVFNAADFPGIGRQRFSSLTFFLAKDVDSNGLPETRSHELIRCDFHSFDLQGHSDYTLTCKNGPQSYTVKEVRLEYEDSNVRWDGLCQWLRISHSPNSAKEYQERCIEEGFNPDDIEGKK